jgi:hypothetical protein
MKVGNHSAWIRKPRCRLPNNLTPPPKPAEKYVELEIIVEEKFVAPTLAMTKGRSQGAGY